MRYLLIGVLALSSFSGFSSPELEFRVKPGSSPRLETLCRRGQTICRYEVEQRREGETRWQSSRQPVACFAQRNRCPELEDCLSNPVTMADIMTETSGGQCASNQRDSGATFY